ncbi:MAG: replication factor C large subunit [Candidatus Woesearchaeota archaeon]
MSKPFTERFRPKNTSEIVGQDAAVAAARKYAKEYKSSKEQALLLHGPPGVGKTSLAVAIAKENDWELVEVNASDVRNKSSIEEVLGASMQQRSLFATTKLILIDEVDGLSGTKDRGGAGALAELIKETKYPVLLTANDAYSQKLKSLRKVCTVVEMGSPDYRSVYNVLQRICEEASIVYEEAALKSLARRAGGDLRGAITDLQTLQKITSENIAHLGGRRQAESMFTALQRIFKSKDPVLAREAVDAVDEDLDELFLWIDENTPREYTQRSDVVAAFDALSRADVHKGRIMRWQHWRYLVYFIDEMTAGVALAKEEKYSGYTKYQRSRRPLTYWQASNTKKKKQAIASKIAEKTHMSVSQAVQDLPFFASMIKADKKHPLITQCELDANEVKWLVARA